MNDALVKEVLNWLSTIRETAQTEAPRFAGELVRMGILWNSMLLCAAVLVGCFATRRLHGPFFDDDAPTPRVFFTLVAVVCLGVAFNGSYDLLEAIFAPRLYVISHLTSLVRK
jgi:hypothetical protein